MQKQNKNRTCEFITIWWIAKMMSFWFPRETSQKGSPNVWWLISYGTTPSIKRKRQRGSTGSTPQRPLFLVPQIPSAVQKALFVGAEGLVHKIQTALPPNPPPQLSSKTDQSDLNQIVLGGNQVKGAQREGARGSLMRAEAEGAVCRSTVSEKWSPDWMGSRAVMRSSMPR